MQVIICDDCKKVFDPEELEKMDGWASLEEESNPNHDSRQVCFIHVLNGVEVQLRVNPYFHTKNSDNFTTHGAKSIAKDYCPKCLSKKLARAAMQVWSVYKRGAKVTNA